LRAELLDRFGTLPPELDGLLFQLRVKLLAYRAHVSAITASADQISIRLPYLAEIDRAALQRFLGEGARVSRTAIWLTRVDESDEWQTRLLRVLERLAVNSPEAAA
jgi:transcription-repair coupling factor (superfamily II helicase)